MFLRLSAPRATLLLCLLAAPAAANQRLPFWSYDDIAQTLTMLDSTGSIVTVGTVNPNTHAISFTAGGGGTLTVPNGGTGVVSFTANQPLIGAGASNLAQGTRSGNTTTFATSTGTLTNGHCVQIDASGNFVDAGGSCTVGGGGGTVTSSAINTLAYYAAAGTTVIGLATANSNVLVTNSSGVPTWTATLPCVNNSASTGDITGTAGTCGNIVTGVQGTAVGAPTGTAGSAVVLKTSPTITTPTITSATVNQPTINQPITMGDTTGAAATAGQVGENLGITGSATGATGSMQNFTSKSITAGHWLCAAYLTDSPTGVIASTVISLSTTTGVQGSAPFYAQTGGSAFSTQQITANTGMWPFDITSTTTVFAVGEIVLSSGTATGTATINCTRIR